IHAHDNGSPKDVFVIIDRFCRTLDHQVRGHSVISLGNVIDLAHDFSPLGVSLTYEVEGWRLQRAAGPHGPYHSSMRTQVKGGLKRWRHKGKGAIRVVPLSRCSSSDCVAASRLPERYSMANGLIFRRCPSCPT